MGVTCSIGWKPKHTLLLTDATRQACYRCQRKLRKQDHRSPDLTRAPSEPIFGCMKSVEKIRSCIGRRGTLVIASEFRRAYGLTDGMDVVQEATPQGILIRPLPAENKPKSAVPTHRHD